MDEQSNAWTLGQGEAISNLLACPAASGLQTVVNDKVEIQLAFWLGKQFPPSV